jgi:hypothetical protein
VSVEEQRTGAQLPSALSRGMHVYYAQYDRCRVISSTFLQFFKVSILSVFYYAIVGHDSSVGKASG